MSKDPEGTADTLESELNGLIDEELAKAETEAKTKPEVPRTMLGLTAEDVIEVGKFVAEAEVLSRVLGTLEPNITKIIENLFDLLWPSVRSSANKVFMNQAAMHLELIKRIEKSWNCPTSTAIEIYGALKFAHSKINWGDMATSNQKAIKKYLAELIKMFMPQNK
jgi:hypothetical protein